MNGLELIIALLLVLIIAILFKIENKIDKLPQITENENPIKKDLEFGQKG